MKKILIILILFVSTIYSSQSHAIMPPMPYQEALETSTVVIEGKVIKVESQGPKTESGCMIKKPYVATIKVEKVIKGKPKKEIQLHFTHRELKDRCVGQPYGLHYVGEKRRFFLRCKENNQDCSVTYRGMITKSPALK